MDGAGAVVGVVFSVVHGVGADWAHMIDPRGNGADGIVVDLPHGVEVDEEVDAIVTDVQGGRAVFALDPVHTGNVLRSRVFDLEARGQHIGDNDIVDIRAESTLEGELYDDEVVLLEVVTGEGAAKAIEKVFADL